MSLNINKNINLVNIRIIPAEIDDFISERFCMILDLLYKNIIIVAANA